MAPVRGGGRRGRGRGLGGQTTGAKTRGGVGGKGKARTERGGVRWGGGEGRAVAVVTGRGAVCCSERDDADPCKRGEPGSGCRVAVRGVPSTAWPQPRLWRESPPSQELGCPPLPLHPHSKVQTQQQPQQLSTIEIKPVRYDDSPGGSDFPRRTTPPCRGGVLAVALAAPRARVPPAAAPVTAAAAGGAGVGRRAAWGNPPDHFLSLSLGRPLAWSLLARRRLRPRPRPRPAAAAPPPAAAGGSDGLVHGARDLCHGQ